MSTKMKFDRARFMKNWWKARLCQDCISAHIGREVDHNHCDIREATSWMEKRVNGHHNHPDDMYFKTKCTCFNRDVA